MGIGTNAPASNATNPPSTRVDGAARLGADTRSGKAPTR